jgi:hypothetical protein
MNLSLIDCRGNFSSVLTARKFGMMPRMRFVCGSLAWSLSDEVVPDGLVLAELAVFAGCGASGGVACMLLDEEHS